MKILKNMISFREENEPTGRSEFFAKVLVDKGKRYA
jgi:hypothetical protein